VFTGTVGLFAAGLTLGLVALGVGAGVAGFRSWARGGCFWRAAANYITDNWALTVSISSVAFMVAVGAKAAVAAKKAANAKKQLASVKSNVANSTSEFSPEFMEWLNKGDANHVVYSGKIGGKDAYFGITMQDTKVRFAQHKAAGKVFDGNDLNVLYRGLTKNQARSIETLRIIEGKKSGLAWLNKNQSVGKNNKFIEEALRWARMQ